MTASKIGFDAARHISLRQLLLVVTAAGVGFGVIRFALVPPTTMLEYVLAIVARVILGLIFCPPWIPLLLLLRYEARRLDSHRK